LALLPVLALSNTSDAQLRPTDGPPEPSGKPLPSDPAEAWLATDNARAALGEYSRFAEAVEHRPQTGFLGAYIDFSLKTFVVVREPGFPDPQARQVIAASQRPGLAIALAAGTRNYDDLLKIRNALVSDRSWLTDKAGFFATIDARSSTVRVTISPSAKLSRERLVKAFPGAISLEDGEVDAVSRCGDLSPHWGGARINKVSGDCPGSQSAICSTAFAARRNSTGEIGMASAGHCRTSSGWSGTIFSGTANYGEFWTWAFNNGFDDWSWIKNSTFDRKVYHDPYTPTSLTVTGVRGAAVGDFLCTSGATTRAVCSGITLTVGSVTYISGATVTAIAIKRNDNAVMCAPGESGGSVYYLKPDQTAEARAIIVAASGAYCYAYPIMNFQSAGYTVVTA
jgi:hypothetical protein